MQTVAQAWLVLELTGDPFVLGLTTAAQFLPVLVFGLFGGLIADALPKRRTLIVTQIVQMLLAFSLFALTASGRVEVWHILVLALLLGLSNAVDMPTRQAFVVEMVGRDDLPNAVALNSATFNAARIVGPAVAGLLIGITGVAHRVPRQRPELPGRHRRATRSCGTKRCGAPAASSDPTARGPWSRPSRTGFDSSVPARSSCWRWSSSVWPR